MNENEYESYFQLESDDNLETRYVSNNCFKIVDNQKVSLGGSRKTENEAYFGFTIEPYCSGSVSECESREGQINSDYQSVFKRSKFSMLISQN